MSTQDNSFELPYKSITKIPDSEPDATPELWNATYREIDENFKALSDKVKAIEAGLLNPYIDLGRITDPAEDWGLPSDAVSGGTSSGSGAIDPSLALLAAHIEDCVHPVNQNIEAVKTVANRLPEVQGVAEITDIAETDYASIFNNGE